MMKYITLYDNIHDYTGLYITMYDTYVESLMTELMTQSVTGSVINRFDCIAQETIYTQFKKVLLECMFHMIDILIYWINTLVLW